MDLYEDIVALMAELTASIRKLRDNGAKLAEAERDYKITLRQEALKLRASDMPVTLINQVIYGVPEVADKRLKRDVEQANYETNREHINVTKLKLRILENQLSLLAVPFPQEITCTPCFAIMAFKTSFASAILFCGGVGNTTVLSST